ncbi:MAG: hypothetical protein GF364_18925, partial [Candidatus Lokiarchaeota archaeon]|nr:hypothetical protein [Candidatus Lokiarchaeota archaeon]
TNGALILFDLTSNATLSHVNNWYDDVIKTAGKVPILIIGNKKDLPYKSAIGDRAKRLCDSLGLDLFLTSAKTGDNMNEVFKVLTKKMMKNPETGVETNG